MAFDAHVLYALIASPGDTLAARDAIERAIYSWNSDRARLAQVVVLPRRWETDSVPLISGEDGQSVLNKQLVDEADIIFGVFHSRLGKRTARGLSGTAEEIERSVDAGKRVHVWFADMPHPPDVDTEQLAALNDFRTELESRGLYGTFVSEDDLAAKVRSAIEHDLEALSLGSVRMQRTAPETAKLRVRYDSYQEPYHDSRGRLKHRTRGEKLIVHNSGTATAHHVGIRVEPVGDEGHAPEFLLTEEMHPDIIPDSEFGFPILMDWGTAPAWQVHLTWQDDDGEVHELMQSVAWV